MNFLGSLGANLLGSLFISLSSPAVYRRISSSLYQIFIINLLLFIILTPFYFIVFQINQSFLVYIAGLHILFSSQASALIQKIITNNRYALLGVYSTLFAMITAIIISILFIN